MSPYALEDIKTGAIPQVGDDLSIFLFCFVPRYEWPIVPLQRPAGRFVRQLGLQWRESAQPPLL